MQLISINRESDYKHSAVSSIREHRMTKMLMFRNAPGYHVLSTTSSHINAEMMANLVTASRRDTERGLHELIDLLSNSNQFQKAIISLLPNSAMVKPNTALFTAESARLALASAYDEKAMSMTGRHFLGELIIGALVSANLMLAPDVQHYPFYRENVIPTMRDLIDEAMIQELMMVFGSVSTSIEFGGMKQISAAELATQLIRQLQKVASQLRAVGHRDRLVRCAFGLLRELVADEATDLPEIHALRALAVTQELLSNFTLVHLVLHNEPEAIGCGPWEYEKALTTLHMVLQESKRFQVLPLNTIDAMVGHEQIFVERNRLAAAVVYRNVTVQKKIQVLTKAARSQRTSLWELQVLADATAAVTAHVVAPLDGFGLRETAKFASTILTAVGTEAGDIDARVGLIGMQWADAFDSTTLTDVPRQAATDGLLITHYAASRSMSIVTGMMDGLPVIGYQQPLIGLNYITTSPSDSSYFVTLDPFEAILVSPSNSGADALPETGTTLPLDRAPAIYYVGETTGQKMFLNTLSAPQTGQIALGDAIATLEATDLTRMLSLIRRSDMCLLTTESSKKVITAHIAACQQLLNLVSEADVAEYGNVDAIRHQLRHQVAAMLNAVLYPVYSKPSTATLVRSVRTAMLIRMPATMRRELAIKMDQNQATAQLRVLVAKMLMRAVDFIDETTQDQLDNLLQDAQFDVLLSSLAMKV